MTKLPARTIMGINLLPDHEKREIYSRLIPRKLINLFNLTDTLFNEQGNDLITLKCPAGSTSVEMSLRHQLDFPDPVLYGHLADTLNGQIHILMYIINDPSSPRFDVDKLPDGTPTKFGTRFRNIQAEVEAKHFGLAPGQTRKGLRLLPVAISEFENFIRSIGQDIYFAEPLYYHNAIIFEQYGFAYQQGRKLMDYIQQGFSPNGDLHRRLDNSTPFRKPEAFSSIRLRSWAIHDGILGEPFSNVTMYKQVGKSAGITTTRNCSW